MATMPLVGVKWGDERVIFNEICFNCNYSTATGLCKWGLNEKSKQLYNKIEKLQTQLTEANEIIEKYNQNVDYYKSELADSWIRILMNSLEYQEKHKEGK